MTLTSKERAIRAFELEMTDRVPFFELLIDTPILEGLTGKKVSLAYDPDLASLRRDLEIMAEGHRKLGLDFFCFYPGCVLGDKVKRLPNGMYIDAWGGIRKPLGFPALDDMYVDGTIKSYDDLESFDFPDATEATDRVNQLANTLRNIGKDLMLVADNLGVFTICLEMRGLTNGLTDFHREPRIPKRIMEQAMAFALETTKAIVDAGAQVVNWSDDYAYKHGLMIPPDLWRKYCKPNHESFVNTWKKRGLFTTMHSDGNIMTIIKELIDIGHDALMPIEPTSMDIGQLKVLFGDRICLIGNVDCGITMTMGTTEDVRSAVRGCIDEASPGGGHILSSSNSLHWQIPFQNAIAMYDEGKRYGRYQMNN